MKLTAMILAAAVMASGQESRKALVCIDGGSRRQEAYAAKVVTSEIFSKIGVKIDWRSLRSCPSNTSAIQVTFSEHTPATLTPGALANARPYDGTHIVVFTDRVMERTKMLGLQSLFGYVLAHEISHVLEGISRHSDAGIMKAQWDSLEYFEMTKHRLGFAPEDIDFIYSGLDARNGVKTAPLIAWQ